MQPRPRYACIICTAHVHNVMAAVAVALLATPQMSCSSPRSAQPEHPPAAAAAAAAATAGAGMRSATAGAVQLRFGKPVLVSTSRTRAAGNHSGDPDRCWCDSCTTWDFPRLNFVGGQPYIQIQTCNDDVHVAWNYFSMTSVDGGNGWVAGSAGLGQQQNGAELMVALNASSSIGIPFRPGKSIERVH